MSKIENFCFHGMPNDAKISGIEEDKTVYDTLSKSTSWNFNGKKYIIDNNHGLIALHIKQENLIALIEAPLNPNENKAYVINGMKKNILDVKSSFKKKYASSLHHQPLVTFFDTYFINKQLFFFLNYDGTDFRLNIDLPNRLIGNLTESK